MLWKADPVAVHEKSVWLEVMNPGVSGNPWFFESEGLLKPSDQERSIGAFFLVVFFCRLDGVDVGSGVRREAPSISMVMQ